MTRFARKTPGKLRKKCRSMHADICITISPFLYKKMECTIYTYNIVNFKVLYTIWSNFFFLFIRLNLFRTNIIRLIKRSSTKVYTKQSIDISPYLFMQITIMAQPIKFSRDINYEA